MLSPRLPSFLVALAMLVAACAPSVAPTRTPKPQPTLAPTPVPYGEEVSARFPFKEPRALAFGFGSLWIDVFGGTLFRLDPSTGAQQAMITDGIRAQPAEMLAAQDSLWVINSQSATISRLDPLTNKVTQRLKFSAVCCSLAQFDGGLWTIDGHSTLSRVDIQTNQVTSFSFPEATLTNGPFVGNNGLWLEVDNNFLAPFNPSTGTLGATIAFAGTPIGFSNGLFWTADNKDIVGVDPATGDETAHVDADGDPVRFFGFGGTFGDGDGQLGTLDGSAMWVIGMDASAAPLLVKIDPAAQKIVGAYHVGPPYYGFISMLPHGDTVWLVDDHNTLLKVQP